MPTHRGGRHEHGQNFLTDTTVVDAIVDAVDATCGPIIEIGPGHGALTRPLVDLGRPVTAVDIDAHAVGILRGSLQDGVDAVHADFLRWRLPSTQHTIVGNVPFHLTTAILRKLLHSPGWSDAVLVVQWEVARRRAGVGGATMMTVQSWPWFEFTVHRRVPREAFDPRPTVDGGVLALSRRDTPLLDPRHKVAYRQFVHEVFTGRGRGIAAVLARLIPPHRRREVRPVLARACVRPGSLPKDLRPEQWVRVFTELGPRRRNGARSGGSGGNSGGSGGPTGGPSGGRSGGRSGGQRRPVN